MEDNFYQNMDNLVPALADDRKVWLLQRLLQSLPGINTFSLPEQRSLAVAGQWLLNYALKSGMGPHKFARIRDWLIFMLLRFGGLRTGEIFELCPESIDLERGLIKINGARARLVPLPLKVAREMASQSEIHNFFMTSNFLKCDPSQLRRSFARCAQACSLKPDILQASTMRRQRALELRLMGLGDDLLGIFFGNILKTEANNNIYLKNQQILVSFIQSESTIKTSARNVFNGKICEISQHGILVKIILQTENNLHIVSVITNTSYENLKLHLGKKATAMVKAPFVRIFDDLDEDIENCFTGKVEKILEDELALEILVRMPCGNLLCALYSGNRNSWPRITEKEEVMIGFSSSSVILTTCNN